jgi:hypothetical protein
MAVQHGMRQPDRTVPVAFGVAVARVARHDAQDAALRVAHDHGLAAAGLRHG